MKTIACALVRAEPCSDATIRLVGQTMWEWWKRANPKLAQDGVFPVSPVRKEDRSMVPLLDEKGISKDAGRYDMWFWIHEDRKVGRSCRGVRIHGRMAALLFGWFG